MDSFQKLYIKELVIVSCYDLKAPLKALLYESFFSFNLQRKVCVKTILHVSACRILDIYMQVVV